MFTVKSTIDLHEMDDPVNPLYCYSINYILLSIWTSILLLFNADIAMVSLFHLLINAVIILSYSGTCLQWSLLGCGKVAVVI